MIHESRVRKSHSLLELREALERSLASAQRPDKSIPKALTGIRLQRDAPSFV